jgi:hypothetical protein
MLRKRAIARGTVRRLALALPETTESRHFNTPDIRVRHKIFVSFPECGRVIGLKCTPANVDALVTADPETFGDLWRGRWLGVRLDRIAQPVLQELITDAWCLAAPKRLVAARATAVERKAGASAKK